MNVKAAKFVVQEGRATQLMLGTCKADGPYLAMSFGVLSFKHSDILITLDDPDVGGMAAFSLTFVPREDADPNLGGECCPWCQQKNPGA